VGTWTYVAGTYDGTKMTIYINGIQVNTFAVCGEIGVHTEPLRLGKDATSGYFKGTIDEVSIYNGALTATEIQSKYQAVTQPAPTVLQAATSTDGKKVLITFNKNMAVLPASPAGFSINVNGVNNPITTV
jgi:hypothetical protein